MQSFEGEKLGTSLDFNSLKISDDLKRKYAGGKLLKYSKIAEEAEAIGWYDW